MTRDDISVVRRFVDGKETFEIQVCGDANDYSLVLTPGNFEWNFDLVVRMMVDIIMNNELGITSHDINMKLADVLIRDAAAK